MAVENKFPIYIMQVLLQK